MKQVTPGLMRKDEMRGINERATGVYAIIHEDCERVYNKARCFSHKSRTLMGAIALGISLFSAMALADINRVRVVNDSNSTIYIHVGGYAPSHRLNPGQWKIYYYPFIAYPPGQKGTAAKTSLLVATAGGRWLTTSNGYTHLSEPLMVICLDYKNVEHAHKTGNRVWTIKRAHGFDKGCSVKGYKQPWHTHHRIPKKLENL